MIGKRWPAVVSGLLLAGIGPTGCGTGARAADVARVADRFAADVAAGDGAAACALLGPGTARNLAERSEGGCAQAVLDEDLPTRGPHRSAAVYGGQALVVFAADTVFLAEFTAGWRVVAAGCEPRRDRPYECAVEEG